MSNEMILTLPSGDPSATGTASNYTLSGIDLELEDDGEYVCALVDVSFGNPGITNNSVYVLLDILEYSFVGGNKFPILYKTRPMSKDPSEEPLYYEKETGSIIQWHRVASSMIHSINVRIEQSTGDPIDEAFFSTVTIVIKRVA